MSELFEETIAPVVEVDVSAMPLQDITMSQTLPLNNGGNTNLYSTVSPGRDKMNSASGRVCRTMKEYEEQSESLKKENFNLKLRIYFLEERMGINSPDEITVKKNVELKVEMQALKRDLEEKQDLLNQAAKAFKLIEKQNEETSQEQDQCHQMLESEREKVAKLQKELAEYHEREAANASIYYKQAFDITPEQALENIDKLRQMEELVASLEVEVKQLTVSLEEERNWAQELENEKDQFREHFDATAQLREKQDEERLQQIDDLREKTKEQEEELLKQIAAVQHHKNELVERDRLLQEKTALLQEKCKAFEEVSSISEKRKKQIAQLRTSVKTRDDAFTDLNNKHRALLSQWENRTSRSPSSSPTTLNSLANRLSPSMGQKPSCVRDIMKNDNVHSKCESNNEKRTASASPMQTTSEDTKEIRRLIKELEEKGNEIKRQEEDKKQLILKLCNTQKQTESHEQKLKKVEGEHEKAIKAIQGFMEYEQEIQNANSQKDQRILELETELRKLRDSNDSVKPRNNGLVSLKDLDVRNVDNSESDSCKQQRFEEMESKINDLRDQVETIKAEKNLLEKRIQIESEELRERLHDKELRIEILETEKKTITEELKHKIIELNKLKQETNTINITESPCRAELIEELNLRKAEIEQKTRKIEQLTKELEVRTRNLQKLVNMELWNKNREIAKLHNHMTASYGTDRNHSKSDTVHENLHLTNLIHELDEIGIKVIFENEVVQLNYVNGEDSINMKALSDYIQRLVIQRNDLEKEVEHLKLLKLVSKPDVYLEIDNCGDENERINKYCELLQIHLKDLVKLMKDIMKNTNRADIISNEQKKIVLDILINSNILSDDFVSTLGNTPMKNILIANDKIDDSTKKSQSENVDMAKNQASVQSDSEAFSEPDRTVSMARIGLQEMQVKTLSRPRFTKYMKTFSDSEDSMDYVPYHKTYQNDLNDLDASHHIQELRETYNTLCSELNALRNDLTNKVSSDCVIDEKLTPFITKLEKSQRFCEKMQTSLEKRIHEFHMLKKENKQNGIRKTQMERKINDVEQMSSEMNRQKIELSQSKENAERKTTEIILSLNKENELLRARIKKLEEENESVKANTSTLTRELDHFTLSHSQILVENTKLINDKLRLEQEMRKIEGRYDETVRSIRDKYSKEISDLNQINDSHRARVRELEMANKEFRRHMAVCEASDSAPSSSGVSSIPTDATLKQACDDIMQEYHSYNNLQYWLPINYSTSGTRSKSSCSPDLGIESDAAVSITRPLKNTLKITESMTNLLSDDDSGHGNRRERDTESESPLPIEGLNEMEALKQENEALKRRLIRTRKALEDTFQHLSTSNKNKKNVEKAITEQLMITRNLLKKTKTYEETLDH